MKKLLLVMAVVAFGFTASAQDGFRIGANLGLPIGDAGDFNSLYINLDVDHDWSVSDDFTVGLSTGYSNLSGKDGYGGFSYLPAAGSVDVGVSDNMSVGGDVGVAFSLEDGGGSDFMYRFQFRYQASEQVDVSARFNSLSGDGSTWSNISIGVGYRF